jgi:hypothetical protein
VGFAALFQHLFENSDVQRFERLQKKKKKKKLAARVGDAKVEREGDSSSASKAKLADVKKIFVAKRECQFFMPSDEEKRRFLAARRVFGK